MKKRNKHLGSSFDDFLDEQKIREVAEATALMRVQEYEKRKSMDRAENTGKKK